MITLTSKWAQTLRSQPEAGMGYQVATVYLKDGRRFEQVMIDSGQITSIKGDSNIPFSESEIEEIAVTHDKWSSR